MNMTIKQENKWRVIKEIRRQAKKGKKRPQIIRELRQNPVYAWRMQGVSDEKWRTLSYR